MKSAACAHPPARHRRGPEGAKKAEKTGRMGLGGRDFLQYIAPAG
jgi:hypothetical protein